MKVFLSGTSSQFKACRELLRSDLAASGHEIRVQEDFQTGTGLLLERIEDYVAAVDRVIVLVGDAYGAEALGAGRPTHTPPRSYTQWEYFFALGERLDGSRVAPKPFHLYFASDGFLAAHPTGEEDDLRDRQLAFATRVKESGQHWAEFVHADRLRALVLRDIRQIEAKPLPPLDDGTYRVLAALEDAIRSGNGASSLPENRLALVRGHSPRNGREHWLHRVAAWSHQRYAVDSRFTRLTLMLDQGRDAEQTRWQAQAESFDDLRAVLAKTGDAAPVVVLLGPPGSGKSTLLRRLEYDLATDAVREGGPDERWTFFVSLGSYTAPPGQPLAPPEDWLTARWAGDFPHHLPAFDEVYRSGRLTLLLDALNEVPHANREDYGARVGLWRTCVVDVVRRAPRTRVVFSCRSLDYSEPLSTSDLAVPQVRIERLTDDQVQAFLVVYSPGQGEAIWRHLKGTRQLDLFRSPYYLKMLIAQSSADGKIPEGRAALFTGFVRQALLREVTAGHPLFRSGGLLEDRDRDRISRHEWRTTYDLPARGPLISSLSALAFGLQERREGSEAAQVRAPLDDALRLLGPNRPEDVLNAGVALQVLEDDRPRDEVLFLHQLLQEYFAARKVASEAEACVADVVKLAHVPWREAELPAVRFESDNDPLPPAPPTGWEETFMLAAAMVPPDPFLGSLMDVNLPLAGRCAAQPDVKISLTLRQALQQRLLERSRDAGADLRSRIAAARALGELGDPRFERHEGPFGGYLLPPLIEIPGGTYSIGSDDGIADERPVHPVTLDGFAIARFPVTNAGWQLFMVAGGYDDDRWWDTETAKRWRRGEGMGEGLKSQWRENRRTLQKDFDSIRTSQRGGRITSKQAEDWEAIARMSDAEFEALLEEWYPTGRRTEPAQWNDPAFNHASQPVVGVCWYEARAFCAWLSAQTDRTLCVPTEPQWEAAARGRNGWRYSWGNTFDPTRCNTFDTHVRRTTPIGVFPRGDTPCRLGGHDRQRVGVDQLRVPRLPLRHW